MKKSLYLAALLFASTFLMTSCEGEDPFFGFVTEAPDVPGEGGGNTPIDTANIVGTWRMTSFSSENPYDLNGDGTSNADIMIETNCYQNETMQFNEDGTGVGYENSYANIGYEAEYDGVTGEFTGNVYTVECIEESTTTNFTWEVNNNLLAITPEGDQTYNASVDGNTFSIVVPDGHQVVDLEDASVTITEDITIIYTKES